MGVAAPAAAPAREAPPAAVLGSAALAPVALCVAMPRSRNRDAAVCALNMWAYLAAYEMPHDDPQRLPGASTSAIRSRSTACSGWGSRRRCAFSARSPRPGAINRFERVLVWCHWMWFFVPHASVVYVLPAPPRAVPSAAARMYAVFDLGAVFYWAIPTAPPWWAAATASSRTAGRSRCGG